MVNRRLVSAALVAAVFLSPGAALAGDREPIYNIRYYSDSTYMEQVGFDQGGCSYYGAGYVSHSGQSTPYTDYELIGYCTDGNWEPF
jgi:hypothetical protein